MTCREICKEVKRKGAELWDAQKRCEAGRAEWLETEVKKRAHAAEDDNWFFFLIKMKSRRREKHQYEINAHY